MEAFSFRYFGGNMLFGESCEPIRNAILAAHLGTESQVAIGRFEEIQLLAYIDAAIIYVIYMEQSFQHARLILVAFISSHLLHVHRDKGSTFLRNGIEVIAARTGA